MKSTKRAYSREKNGLVTGMSASSLCHHVHTKAEKSCGLIHIIQPIVFCAFTLTQIVLKTLPSFCKRLITSLFEMGKRASCVQKSVHTRTQTQHIHLFSLSHTHTHTHAHIHTHTHTVWPLGQSRVLVRRFTTMAMLNFLQDFSLPA